MRNLFRSIASLITVSLILLLPLSLNPPLALAAYVYADDAASTLAHIGLFKGGDDGFELDRELTRQEAVVFLIRFLGAEDDALKLSDSPCPFSDVDDWAKAYASYAFQHSLALGNGDGTLNANAPADANSFLTFILRALGYSDDSGDFSWNSAVLFADSIGLTRGVYSSSEPFLREDAVLVSYSALTLRMKDSSTKLIEYLIEQNVVNRDLLFSTPLSGYINYGKEILSSEDIYERSSAAVFLLEIYESEEDFDAQKPIGTASGFFISNDGLALMTYHAIELYPYARVTTTNGKIYEDLKVLYYDGYRDIAVMRVGKTAADGSSISAFPHIPKGNSDAIANGERIYTLSNPIGLQDCISDGIISTKQRIADDILYPFIQFTAPISPGSSGGVLLNEYGEAIGILLGTFAAGYNLNLAVPVNCLIGASYDNAGKTIKEVCEYDTEVNLNSTLRASKSRAEVKVEDTIEILITRNSPGSVSLRFDIDEWDVVECEWAAFQNKLTVPLRITGISRGTAVITVTYTDRYGNPDAEAVITVTVI